MRVATSLFVLVVACSAVVGPAAAVAGTSPAAVPADQTPYGIETVYRNPDLQRTSGGAGVDVAVLDTGVDTTHPDIRGQVELCRDYTGESVRHGSCADGNGHGTMVAGTILADGGPNGNGLYGVVPDADLYAFKVCTDDGKCPTAAMRDAIRDAADAGAEVIVMSLGGKLDPHVQAAVQYAHERGALLVAAAGNSGPALDTMDYPAADRLVMAVGAVGRRTDDGVTPDNFEVPAFSSRGADASKFREADGLVEVAAPGVDVLSTAPGGGYRTRSGTSFAAPHVGGLAAKLWFDVPDANRNGRRNDDVRARLRERARTFDVTHGEYARTGYDPAAGIGVPTSPSPAGSFSASADVPLVGETVQFTAGSSSPGDSPVARYAWDLDGDGRTDATGQTVTTRFSSPGRHNVTLTVEDVDGNIDIVTREMLVNDRPSVSVSVPGTLRADRPVTLTAAVRNEVGTTTVTWQFPDGTTVAGTSVRRQFGPGTHEVTVVVEDEFGATVRTTVILTVPERQRTPRPEKSGRTQKPAEGKQTKTPADGPSTPVPGFGAPAAVVALVAAAILVRHNT